MSISLNLLLFFFSEVNVADREKLTVPYAVNMWLDGGFPANKLALGLATYGRAFTLSDPSQNGFGAPSSAWDAPMGHYTGERMAIFQLNNSPIILVNILFSSHRAFMVTDFNCG